jgi:hypothetical protein
MISADPFFSLLFAVRTGASEPAYSPERILQSGKTGGENGGLSFHKESLHRQPLPPAARPLCFGPFFPF